MNARNLPAGHWTYERCKRTSLHHKNRTSFRKHCPGAYKASRENDWLDEFYPNTKLDASALEYWTYERCREEAEKYGLRSDFQRYSYAAYQVAYRNGWIEEFMPDKRKSRRCFRHPIIEQLNEHLEAHPLPASEVAEKAGVSINTISRWRHGAKPDLDLLAYVLEAMDLKVVVVPIETE